MRKRLRGVRRRNPLVLQNRIINKPQVIPHKKRDKIEKQERKEAEIEIKKTKK